MLINFFNTFRRILVKNKIYALLNIAGLAIGVVVCLLIGVWLQRELSFDNFHPNGDAIFRLAQTFKSESESFSGAYTGPAEGLQLPKQLPDVKAACRLFTDRYKIKGGNDEFFESKVLIADSNFFQFFGFKLKEGQTSQCLQSFNQVVLTENMAKKYFGNVNPIGKTILLNNDNLMIVSAVAENAPVNSQIQFDFLMPFSSVRKNAIENWQTDIDTLWGGIGWVMTYVQLTDPKKWKEGENKINEVAAKFEKYRKGSKISNKYFLQQIKDIHLKSNLRFDADNNGSLARVNIFSIVGIIILLLACINYVNLTTASAMKRAKETSVRKIVGATKLELVRQFLLETFIISVMAVCLGVFLFKLFLPAFSQWIGQPYYFLFTATNILIILAGIILITLFSGIYPAIILSAFNPAIFLKGNFFQNTSGNFIRKGLVIFQFTISIALVASILIITKQMNYIKNKSIGFKSDALLEVNFNGEESVIKQYTSLRNELIKNPYILNVSKHDQNIAGGFLMGPITTENLKGEQISTSLFQQGVDPDYFDVYNMKLAAGRFLSKSITNDTAKAVLINEAAVKAFGWQRPENAVGKKIIEGDETKYVVGVVKDFNFESLHKPVEPLLINFSPWGGKLSLKVDGNHIKEAISYLTQTWKYFVPNVPLQYSFVDDKIAEQYGNDKKMEDMFYSFSGLSLLIACLGLFGLTSFVVERKTKEIGIRKVLGASVSGIVQLISKDFLKLVIIAIIIATPIAWWAMRIWLQNFAYRINISWWMFALAGCIAIFIALLTVSFQAIKAAIANPVKSLRTE